MAHRTQWTQLIQRVVPATRRRVLKHVAAIDQKLHRSYIVHMSADLSFEWDPRKSASNARKHKVTFEEARSAFADPNGLVIDDPDHSEDEERFILLGLSYGLRLLVVCHVLRADVVRIISARKATPRETATYRRNR
jgi:uncharacterized DUF497 family protein